MSALEQDVPAPAPEADAEPELDAAAGAALLDRAAAGWLSNREIVCALRDWQALGLACAVTPPQLPTCACPPVRARPAAGAWVPWPRGVAAGLARLVVGTAGWSPLGQTRMHCAWLMRRATPGPHRRAGAAHPRRERLRAPRGVSPTHSLPRAQKP
jgi:hypothetical protein